MVPALHLHLLNSPALVASILLALLAGYLWYRSVQTALTAFRPNSAAQVHRVLKVAILILCIPQCNGHY